MIDKDTITEIKKITFQYLNPDIYKVFIFGSRADNTSRKYSDLDLGIESNKSIDLAIIGQLNEAFEESDIPYKIDVVDFSTLSEQFKNISKKQIINLN